MSTDSGPVAVKVAVRCRPLIPKEVNEGCQTCVEFMPNVPQVILGNDKAFTYDSTFGPQAPQLDVFDTVVPLIENLFKGYNATVLAYGQTGSGKTYTMGTGGAEMVSGTGITPRVSRMIFDLIEEKTSDDTTYTVCVSFLEIYKEDVIDLLASNKENLPVRENPEGGIMVAGLSETPVLTAEETLGKLNDGSKRLQEGININRGLLSLGNVISALADEKSRKKDGHVPYRDSKLTRILQDSLGGNSHTMMIACVSPADSNMEETLSTLRYADRAKRIKNKPTVNRDARHVELCRLRTENANLRLRLAQYEGTDVVPPPPAEGATGAAATTAPAAAANTKSTAIVALQGKVEELTKDNKQLVADLRVVMDQNVGNNEKIMTLDMERDAWKHEINVLKEQADQLLFTPVDDKDERLATCTEFLSTLSHKLLELLSEKPAAAVGGDVSGAGGDGDGSQLEDAAGGERKNFDWSESQYTKEQAERCRDMARIEEGLSRKVEEMRRAKEEGSGMSDVVEQHRQEVDALQRDIDRLQGELTQVKRQQHANTGSGSRLSKLSGGAGPGPDPKLKKMIEDKEQQLTALRRKLVEQSKLLKLKEQNDNKIQHLKKEIINMKQAKVKLIKQMKEELEKFRHFKIENEKKLNKLIAKDRKKQAEIVRLERKNELQENKLKRKMEETAAAQKRLKDALDKQKAAQDSRNERVITGSSGDRIRKFLQHEIDIKTGTKECKQHLESMTDERKALMRKLRQTEAKLGEPPAKKAATSMQEDTETPSESPSTATKKLTAEKDKIKRELHLKNDQILDLHKKIMAADENDRQKHKWSNLTNLQEAKYAATYLMEQVVDNKMEAFSVRQQWVDTKEEYRSKCGEVESLQAELEEVRTDCDDKHTAQEQQHNDKVLVLLSQVKPLGETLPHLPDEVIINRVEQQDVLLEEFKERIQEQNKEIQRIKQVNMTKDRIQNIKTPMNSRRMSFFPDIEPSNDGPKVNIFTAPAPVKTVKSIPSALQSKKRRQQQQVATSAASNAVAIAMAGPSHMFTDDDMLEDSDDDGSFNDDSKDEDWERTPVAANRRKTKLQRKGEVSGESPSSCSCQSQSSCQSRRCGCRRAGTRCGPECRCDRTRCGNHVTAPSTTSPLAPLPTATQVTQIDSTTAHNMLPISEGEEEEGESDVRRQLNETFACSDTSQPEPAPPAAQRQYLLPGAGPSAGGPNPRRQTFVLPAQPSGRGDGAAAATGAAPGDFTMTTPTERRLTPNSKRRLTRVQTPASPSLFPTSPSVGVAGVAPDLNCTYDMS